MGEEDTTEAIVYRQADCYSADSGVQADAATTVHLRGRTLTWRVVLDVTSDARSFHFRFERLLLRDRKIIRKRRWKSSIARDFQ